MGGFNVLGKVLRNPVSVRFRQRYRHLNRCSSLLCRHFDRIVEIDKEEELADEDLLSSTRFVSGLHDFRVECSSLFNNFRPVPDPYFK